MTAPVRPAKDRHLRGMGPRAAAAYLLVALPFSVPVIACGVFLPVNAFGGPEESAGARAGLWLYGLMLVLVGLSILVPTTVSTWHRVRASRAYRRDGAAGVPRAEAADRLELRWMGIHAPIGMVTGEGVPPVAGRVNRLLAGSWLAGVAAATVTIVLVRAS